MLGCEQPNTRSRAKGCSQPGAGSFDTLHFTLDPKN